jgi:hypothetical protein
MFIYNRISNACALMMMMMLMDSCMSCHVFCISDRLMTCMSVRGTPPHPDTRTMKQVDGLFKGVEKEKLKGLKHYIDGLPLLLTTACETIELPAHPL